MVILEPLIMAYDPQQDPNIGSGEVYADVDPSIHPTFVHKSDIFSPPYGWKTYGLHGSHSPDWNSGEISITQKRKQNFLIPKRRWGGIQPRLAKSLIGFPDGVESLTQNLLFGSGLQFSVSVFSRTVSGNVLTSSRPGLNWSRPFNGSFDNSPNHFPQFEGQLYAHRDCFLVWCLVPGVRYRLYWVKGDENFWGTPNGTQAANPSPASTYYTEFTARKHYKWLFLEPEPTEYPFDELGLVPFEVSNAIRYGTLWNGSQNDHGTTPFADAQGGWALSAALIPYRRSYFSVEPLNYAGINGSYSQAVQGTFVPCE